jgi:hypothetical protein
MTTRRRSSLPPAPQGWDCAVSRFDTTAEAIRFAVEELRAPSLIGVFLQVEDERFEGDQIHELYDSSGYPFARAT